MTPKEKAKELATKFNKQLNVKINNDRVQEAKNCAIVCVNEIILSSTNIKGDTLNDEYWKDVINEISKF